MFLVYIIPINYCKYDYMTCKLDINDIKMYNNICDLYINNKNTIQHISKVIGCAPDTLRKYMRLKNIKAYKGELHYNLINDIQCSIDNGLTTAELAKKYSVNIHTVRAFIRKHNIKRLPNIIEILKQKELIQPFLDDWHKGIINSELSNKYGITLSNILFIQKYYKLTKPQKNRIDNINKSQIIDDFKQGINIHDIGIKHGTSFKFIHQILKDVNIDAWDIKKKKQRKFLVDRNQLTSLLIDDKYTIGDISRKYNVSSKTIINWVKKLNVVYTPYINCSRFTSDDLSELTDMYFNKDLSLLEMAVKLNTDQETIRRFFIHHGVKLKPQKNRHKRYTLPSGKVIILQGYEGMCLDYIFKHNILLETDIIYDPPTIYYTLNNIRHRYYPDFYIPKYNTILEVKSRYTLKIQGEDKQKAKERACIDLGYKYLIVMDNNFTNLHKLTH